MGLSFAEVGEEGKVPRGVVRAVLVLTVFSTLFFPFWRVWRFPSDLDGTTVQSSNAVIFLDQARKAGLDAREYLQNQKMQWAKHGSSSAITFDQYPASSPLSSWLLYWAYRLWGVGVVTHNLLQGGLQLLTVGVVFLLGWAMYGQLTGLFAALFLSASLYFNIISKFAMSHPLVTTLMATCTFYLFFLAHKNRSTFLLYGAVVFLGLTWFNGWMGITVPLLILGSAVLMFGHSRAPLLGEQGKVDEPECFRFELKTYFSAIWVVVGSFLLFCYLYSTFFNLPFSLTLKYLYDMAISRGQQVLMTGSLADRLEFLPFVLRCLFIGVIPFTQGSFNHTSQSLPGAPIIEPVTTLFLVAGLLSGLRRWSPADRLCLVWVGVGLALPTFLSWFRPRYNLVGVAGRCPVGSKGNPCRHCPTSSGVKALFQASCGDDLEHCHLDHYLHRGVDWLRLLWKICQP